jgi:Oxidoreductase family, NAD-binding Rossmann fold
MEISPPEPPASSNAYLKMKDLNVSNVAVIGGGRWGAVICSVLEHLLPANIPVWLVSRHMPAERVPRRVRRIFDLGGLPHPGGTGAAVVATAPHEHAQTALRCLSAGWHVLVEKPFTLDLRDARVVVERAAELKRHLWVGLVYLFAPYLPVMKPYAGGKAHWRLEWCEPNEEMRWGELKSTPHHVTAIEDIFPHAWSILRASGLTEPLEIRHVDMTDLSGVRLYLAAGEATVELIFDRHAGFRRRYLEIGSGSFQCELDFSNEPGIFKVNGTVLSAPPWSPERGPLALELSAFLAACSGQASADIPIEASRSLEAVALMQEATKAFLAIQARAIAGAARGNGCIPGLGRVLFDAVCREAAMAGLRVSESSDEGRALAAAAQAFIWRNENAFPELSSELASLVRRSPFLVQVRQRRQEILNRHSAP